MRTSETDRLLTGLLQKWQQKVMRGERPGTPPSDVKRQFDAWFAQEMSRASGRPDGQATPPSLVHLGARSAAGGEKAGAGQRVSPVAQEPLCAAGEAGLQHARADGLPPRVRMRTTFDPEQELPRLQRWFAENQHPTRFQVSRSCGPSAKRHSVRRHGVVTSGAFTFL